MSLTSEYMAVAEGLLEAAEERPDERVTLSNAAAVAQDAARDARDVWKAYSGLLMKAVDLVRPGITDPLPRGTVATALGYLDQAKLWAEENRPADELR